MATSLLDWIEHLMRDSDAREAFLDHPNRYAEEHGFGNLSSADVHDALALIADRDVSYFDGGPHFPAPRHWQHDGDHDGTHYLRGYFDDNRSAFERSDTDLDNSVHQDIDTGDRHHDHWRDHDDWRGDGWDDWHDRGGDFHQTIDNDPVVASGDDSVATGGDLTDSTVTSGQRNLAGPNNEALTGDDPTQHTDRSAAFGSGDATNSDIGRFHGGDGSALSIGGDSFGRSSDDDTRTSVHNSGDGDTSVNAAGDHGYANQYADQHHQDNSEHSDYEHHSSTDSHDDLNSHNSDRFADSHDVDIHH